MRIHKLELGDTPRTRDNPWRVTKVTKVHGSALYLLGTNAYDNDRLFVWQCGYHTFTDPSFVSRRYTFHDAEWGPGARATFDRIVARAKRERRRRSA